MASRLSRHTRLPVQQEVTMGAGDSLKIYWPIPEQAGSSSRLYVVHYYGLDRTETDAGAELSAEPRHVQQADIEQVGGVRYAVFEVSSFSPFALVWEESVDSPLPITPPVTPSEPDYTPNWLNTTDHVSYIIGYSDGTVKDVPLLCRIDTLDEVTYMNNGGILQTVLRDLAA